MPITVIVCGGRKYGERAQLDRVLSEVHAKTPIGTLCHGGATGVDTMAHEWALRTADINVVLFVPEWNTYGKAAGPIRNQKMLADGKPDLVIAFPGGKGTSDMIRRAVRAKIEVLVIEVGA